MRRWSSEFAEAVANPDVVEVTMPDPGTPYGAKLVAWHRRPGDAIEEGEPICTINADGVRAEVGSPASGTVTRLRVGIGATVHGGRSLAEILPETAVAPEPEPQPDVEPEEVEEVEELADEEEAAPVPDEGLEPVAEEEPARAAEEEAERAGEEEAEREPPPDPEPAGDLGEDGEVEALADQEPAPYADEEPAPIEADAAAEPEPEAEPELEAESELEIEQELDEEREVEAALEEESPSLAEAELEPVPETEPEAEDPPIGLAMSKPTEPPSPVDLAAFRSPAVRRLAARHEIDLGAIEGSGRDGRVTREDVLAHLRRLGRVDAEERELAETS